MSTAAKPYPQSFLWDAKAGLTPTDAPIPADRKGVVLRDQFQRGSYAISSISASDTRFIEPVGFARTELMHEDSFYGYFQTGENLRPRPIRMFIDELMARAAGLTVHSPRGQKDQVASMEWNEFGKQARSLLLYVDGQLLREARGAGDLRPELTATPDQCIRDRDLHVTSESRRQVDQFVGRGREHQISLLTPARIEDDLLTAQSASESAPAKDLEI